MVTGNVKIFAELPLQYFYGYQLLYIGIALIIYIWSHFHAVLSSHVLLAYTVIYERYTFMYTTVNYYYKFCCANYYIIIYIILCCIYVFGPFHTLCKCHIMIIYRCLFFFAPTRRGTRATSEEK